MHVGTSERTLEQLGAWSFAPDNVIVVPTSPTTPDGVVEEFVRALEPVSGTHLAKADASVGAEC